jgi:hypothetical protein
MKSAIEKIRELSEACKDHPSVVPLLGAVLELEEKVRVLGETKQDKPTANNLIVMPNDLTRGQLQARMFKILSAAGEQEHEVALKIHSFLSSLQ